MMLGPDLLKVVLDTDTVSPEDSDVEFYLIGLVELPDMELLRYSDDGPPEADLRESDFFEERYAVGWLQITSVEDPGYDLAATATYSLDGKSVRQSVVRGGDMPAVPLRFILQQLDDPESHRDQVRRDVILTRACEAAKTMLLITNRSTLIDPIPTLPGWRSDTLPLTPREAVPIVGLWLRARGQYIVQAGQGVVGRTDRTGFYSIAAGELVPARWRWTGALPHISAGRREHARDFLLALHSRVASALKTRDREQSAFLWMSPSDARDESIDCVVEVAANMMGAFDAAAQLIELVNPTGTTLREAKWQHGTWTKNQHAVLPAVVDTARRHRPIFNVIRMLRNTVHGRLMTPVVVRRAPGRGRHDDEDYLALPFDQTEILRNALQSSGGFQRWQVRELLPGHLHAEPRRLIDRMIMLATAALDQIMGAVPLETLLNITDPLPTAQPNRQFIRGPQRANVKLQLGVVEDPAAMPLGLFSKSAGGTVGVDRRSS